MIIELIIVCVTVYAIFGAYMRAKTALVWEEVHSLEIKNDAIE